MFTPCRYSITIVTHCVVFVVVCSGALFNVCILSENYFSLLKITSYSLFSPIFDLSIQGITNETNPHITQNPLSYA